MILTYDISDLQPYINWVYFYFAWQLKDKAEQQRIRSEAETFLQECEGHYQAYALFQIVEAHAEGEDVLVERGRIPLLRQQEEGSQFLCLSDFVSPVADKIGLFATSVDAAMVSDFDDDPYQKMMAQLLADRLAEAAAERMHEEVRKHYWGYAKDEQLSIAQMQQEQFQGIRPAVGYPSLPDASLNFVLDELLDFQQIGISLTESGAMRPHASVSGLMLSSPESHYFSVGRIGEDQLADYARRRQMPIDKMRKFLTANL
ncbi:vitamin B12 dependent-methionine synthase activation domain-containing protein [uncultured Prevotella sp.]|uniref:vitamin B12 dependent-methionine synthase activation domain-containing protein n=1 Tax=uncultured Prevotella sp. TaxID=159272 RepID=UPI0025DD8E9A|nr:vitamin B12 dependent-methionine synthase activation domain-containing protein [uncultured Prevotella sp.]